MSENTSKKKRPFTVLDLTQIALLAAIVCVLGPLAVPLPFSEVPVSLGILGIFLALVVGGFKNGTISIIIYILLGLVGVPVFANFTGGFAKLAGPTGGYIIGYIPMAVIAGLFIYLSKRKIVFTIIGLLLGLAVCYAFGSAWLGISTNMGFVKALAVGVLPYIPFDLAKLAIALAVGIPVQKAVSKFTNKDNK